MKIEVKEVMIAWVSGSVPEKIYEEMVEMNATMWNDDGGGQYPLENLRDRFSEDSEEYEALDDLLSEGYDFIEYS